MSESGLHVHRHAHEHTYIHTQGEWSPPPFSCQLCRQRDKTVSAGACLSSPPWTVDSQVSVGHTCENVQHLVLIPHVSHDWQ